MKNFLSTKKKNSFLQTFSLYKGQSFLKKHSLAFNNIAQVGGALNDNLFKFATVYLLISQQGSQNASSILFIIGIVYVLPFIFFSSIAGVIADNVSKQKMIVSLKALEIIVVLFGMLFFALKSAAGCYASMFLLSFQSALMSPPKYSIIPELVPKNQISKANGIITSSTYLAINLGTFLASWLTDFYNKDFNTVVSFCLLVAIVGFISSLFIPTTEAHIEKKKIHPFFLKEVIGTLRYCKTVPNLLQVVFAAVFFLFTAAFLQLNMIPFAIESLGLSDVGGGYLFLVCSIGITIGAALSGFLSRGQVNVAISSFAVIALGICLVLIPIGSYSLVLSIILMVLIGIFGGTYIVPIDAYMQSVAAPKKRGQVIATVGFLQFIGVGLAPCFLYLFNNILGWKPIIGFFVFGVMTLLYGMYFLWALFPLCFPVYVRMALSPFFSSSFQNELPPKGCFCVHTRNPILVFCLLFLKYQEANYVFYTTKKRALFFFLKRIPSVTVTHTLPKESPNHTFYLLSTKEAYRKLKQSPLLKTEGYIVQLRTLPHFVHFCRCCFKRWMLVFNYVPLLESH